MNKLTLCLLLLLFSAQADSLPCAVVEVINGDTITCSTNGSEPIKVRLYQIDAPELDQAYGQKAKQALDKAMGFHRDGNSISVRVIHKDNIGNVFAEVTYFGLCSGEVCVTSLVDVNQKMIEQGYAWHDPLSKKNQKYIQVEQEARSAKRGLWADEKPVPPWKWRKK